jgi:hypothetical protein
MPTVRRTRARIQQEQDLELENPDDISKAIAETGGEESQVILSVENEEKLGSYDFVTKMPVGAFDLSAIQARYGGGQYRATFFNKVGEQVRIQEFGIKDVPNDDEESSATSMNERLMQMMVEMNANRSRESQPNSDSGTTILLPILLKLLDRNPLQDIAALATIMKGDGSGGMPMDKMMEQLRLERESSLNLGKQLGSAGAGDDSFWKTALTELGPAVGAIAQRIGQPTPAQGMQAVTPQQPQQIAATSIPPHLTWLLPLRGHLPALLDKARKGRSPSVWANVLLEEMPDEMLEKLEASTKNEGFVDVIIGAIPEFQEPALQPWGRAFLQELKDHFVDDESDDISDTDNVSEKARRDEALAKLRSREKTAVVTNATE